MRGGARPEPQYVVVPSGRPVLPRPGLEALRLALFAPELVADRLAAPLFAHPTQRVIFEQLRAGLSVSQAVDALEGIGESEAAAVLGELSVSELDRAYTTDDVTSVVAQMLRSAVAKAQKDIERGVRVGSLDPTTALTTIRDLKIRVDLLGTPQGESVERDLREWLVAREVSPS